MGWAASGAQRLAMLVQRGGYEPFAFRRGALQPPGDHVGARRRIPVIEGVDRAVGQPEQGNLAAVDQGGDAALDVELVGGADGDGRAGSVLDDSHRTRTAVRVSTPTSSPGRAGRGCPRSRSEEHTSELQSL